MQELLHFSKSLDGSPTVEVWKRTRRSGFESLILRTTADLIDQGFITTVNHEADHYVIGMKYRSTDLPMAAIVFEPRLSQDQVHVILGAVDPKFQRQGYYESLFGHLKDFVRNHFPTVKQITGCYHVNNKAAAAMNHKLGREPVRVNTALNLHGE